ncbi:MAG: prepilin-type N-terminal cleavage/methylation domain-containing protein, partial [Guyparkeria sp.]|uniref:prepilin-type N-terminal cleavage/methylation domain-containing protein n=1 Tax=Guyparkeria sp. TaxID=2035736 RepID=UPI00397BDF2D
MNIQAMRRPHPARHRGFTLIEALVGVVVLSIGLLAIASLQTGVMTSTGESKARSEAMQIAEGQMEALRGSYSDRTEFNDLDDTFNGRSVTLDGSTVTLPDGSNTDYKGTNAEYTVEWAVDVVETDTSGAPLLFLAGIRVSWQGPAEADGEEQAVTTASFIGWDSPSAGAAAADAGDPSGGGNLISPPTGEAFQGGRVYQDADGNADLPDGAVRRTATVGDTEIALDSYTYTAPDGAREVIGADGRVLLTIPSGKEESTISGIIYSTEKIDSSNFEITASDASTCERFSLDSAGVDYPNDYKVAEYYECTVGPAWYGNVGVARFGNAGNNDRICVGRPGEQEVARWDSLHPALSTVRAYRGFKDRDPDSDSDLPISTGIGIDPDSGQYTPQSYVDHDFLLSKFGGNPDNDDCDAELAKNASLYDDSWGEGFCFTGSAEDNSG